MRGWCGDYICIYRSMGAWSWGGAWIWQGVELGAESVVQGTGSWGAGGSGDVHRQQAQSIPFTSADRCRVNCACWTPRMMSSWFSSRHRTISSCTHRNFYHVHRIPSWTHQTWDHHQTWTRRQMDSCHRSSVCSTSTRGHHLHLHRRRRPRGRRRHRICPCPCLPSCRRRHRRFHRRHRHNQSMACGL